ncbi:hypothetical protein C0J52_01825 [Blattella germanica]|nr:hypothetical protein C0J52_01825 [Blattella germanica]
MSWLRNSPLRASFGKLRPSNSPPKDCDPTACYDSFKKHWQQTHEIIERTRVSPPNGYPIQDDVLGVVNHLDQMVSFLLLELRTAGNSPSNENRQSCPCLDYLLSENLLDKLFAWSIHTGRFVIFTLLIPFVHREGGIGQQARDALLLCMSLSKKNENVGSYIAEHSNVCPVLATGLSGLYSLLPRKLLIETDDWHRLTPDDVNDINELTMFMNSLEFCNAVVQVAHPVVKNQMLEFLYQGFLVPVMGPALLQSTVEELVAATAYFDLFLRSITDPGLLYSFVRFLLEDKYDGERILDNLIQRINTKSRLCLVTLALFETLVDLNCEDVMLELVFRYLVPCTHVMLSQRRRVRDIEPYCRSSEKFHSLSPACCNLSVPAIRPSAATDCAPHSYISPSPSLPAMLTPSAHHRRSSSFSDHQPTSLPSTSTLYGLKSGESLYGNYHAYLCDARRKIKDCATACAKWTYRYDGENPPHDALAANKDNKNCDINQSNSREESVNIKESDNKQNASVEKESVPVTLDNKEKSKSKSMTTKTEEEDAGNLLASIGIISKLSLEEQIQENPDKIDEIDTLKVVDSIVEPCNNSGDTDCNNAANNNDVTNVASNYHSLPSIGESSGYESFALKGSSESTPENEPSDDRQTDLDLGVSMDLRTQITVSKSKDSDLLESRDNSREGSSEGSVKNVPRHRLGSSSSIYSRTEDLSKSDGWPFSRKYSREGSYLDIFNTTPDIGPFLDVILKKLETMMSNSLYVNLHLTGLISRLAVYPQPLLHSFLLNHSLVLGSLKQKIDQYLARQQNLEELVAQAQDFLVGREDKLVNARKHALEALNPNINFNNSNPNFNNGNSIHSNNSSRRSSLASDPFSRGEPKRRSFSSALSSVFRRAPPQTIRESQLERTGPGPGNYRYWNRSFIMSESAEMRNVVMCAVLLDEWLKELASITQEQAVASRELGLLEFW